MFSFYNSANLGLALNVSILFICDDCLISSYHIKRNFFGLPKHFISLRLFVPRSDSEIIKKKKNYKNFIWTSANKLVNGKQNWKLSVITPFSAFLRLLFTVNKFLGFHLRITSAQPKSADGRMLVIMIILIFCTKVKNFLSHTFQWRWISVKIKVKML